MALEGSLRDLSLLDLIQLFQNGRKTGVLSLEHGVEQGEVYVRAGCLIDAALLVGPARQVLATADDAMIRLLQWEDAEFAFQPDPTLARRPARMVHDHAWLILEAGRLRERSLELPPGQAISLDTCFTLSSAPGATGAFRLDLVQWRMLSQVAVSTSARDICSRGGVEPAQALARLAHLLALGLIERQ
jgi:hypothetical protein